MSGLTKVTALLFHILVVRGDIFLEEKYLRDGDHVEHYQSSYSDYPRSDYFGNAFKSGYDSWKPKFVQQYRPGNFNYRRGVPNWYPVANPGKIAPNMPIDRSEMPVPADFPLGPMEPSPPIGSTGQGGYPRITKPARNGRSRVCQHIKGLPKPESGCCGMQLTQYPVQQQYPNYQYPSSHKFESNRFERSVDTDRHTAPNKMIRGGRATDLHQLPWMVRLAINSQLPGLHGPDNCGGTIISSRYIITAAHCVHNTFKDLDQLEVFLAEYDTEQFPKDCIKKDGKRKCIKNVVMKVEHVIIHKDYNDTYLQNDVALLRLSTDIPYTPFIRPICLPSVDVEELEYQNLIIAGWGLNGKKETNLKQAAIINYVENNKCKEQYSYKDDSLFCSIGEHGEDICHGDSGGPLMVAVNGKYFLSGVVNGKRRDHECGSSVPSLFNNVYYHMNWIVKNVS